MDESDQLTAVEMAKGANVDPKLFRRALMAKNFSWHRHNARWTVKRGGRKHCQMLAVLEQLPRRRGD